MSKVKKEWQSVPKIDKSIRMCAKNRQNYKNVWQNLRNCFQKVELVCGCVLEAGKANESVLKLKKVKKVCQKLRKFGKKWHNFLLPLENTLLH